MPTKTESVTVQVKELLDQYNRDFAELVQKASKEAADETARDIRESASAMFGNGRYAKGWKATKKDGGWIVHNATDYQLTHLLENGHVIRNKYGEYGRAPAYKHIGPAEQRGIVKFENLIEEGADKI